MAAGAPRRAERARRDRPASDVATREQLLIAAGDLMTERGSTDISLSDIAERSGLNSALVSYYFGGKSGLLIALLRSVLGPSLAQLKHLPDMNVPVQDKLRIHISGMVKSYFRYPYVNPLIHRLLSEDPQTFGPLIAEEISKPVAQVQRSILEEGIAAGVFRPIDPMLFYVHVIGACDQLFYARYQLEHLFGVTEITDALRRDFVDHLYGIVLDGILLRPSGAAG